MCIKIQTILSLYIYIYINVGIILPQSSEKYIRSFPWMGMLLQFNAINHAVQHSKDHTACPYRLLIENTAKDHTACPYRHLIGALHNPTLRSCHTKQRKHVDQEDVLTCSKPPNWQVLVQYMWSTTFQSSIWRHAFELLMSGKR